MKLDAVNASATREILPSNLTFDPFCNGSKVLWGAHDRKRHLEELRTHDPTKTGGAVISAWC